MNGIQPLILRHRPSDWLAIRGHEAVVGVLQRRIADPGHPHAYLLSGPSGVGKTTIGRVISSTLGAELTEVDAASHSGVDSMRALVEFSRYRAGAGSRMILIDECHRLSNNAWDAMLKPLEEPPEHLYWCLCTTEFDDVPDTIVTRCYHTKLERLPDRVIEEYLYDILDAEGWVEVCNPDVFRLICLEAQGSPRLALTLLETLYDAPNVEEARRVIALSGSADPLIQIIRVLVSGQGNWQSIQPLLGQLSDSDLNQRAVIGACRYACAVMSRESNADRAKMAWEVLAYLTYPAHGFDVKTLFYAAVGRALCSTF